MIQCVFAYKVIKDIAKTIKQDVSVDSFEIVPAPDMDKNASPVLRGEKTLGIESWAVRHVLPYAHDVVLNSKSNKDIQKLAECILAVNLLHPLMPTAWNKRKELLLQGKLQVDDELRITCLALSVVPKCNEALAHRRWLMDQKLIPSDGKLESELELMNVIADRYPSNYHAWSHRQWCLRKLTRFPSSISTNKLPIANAQFPKNTMIHAFKSTCLLTYLQELTSNLSFISVHVSDHSGLHHRTFLLTSIFSLFSHASNMSQLNSDDSHCDNDALSLYLNLKSRIVEFFQDFKDSYVVDYVSRVQSCLTICDIVLSMVLEELKSNTSLNQIFEDHESLWCFRRFLIFKFCEVIKILVCDAPLVADAYTRQLLVNEQTFINSYVEKRCADFDDRILKRYCDWLKREAKLHVVIINPAI